MNIRKVSDKLKRLLPAILAAVMILSVFPCRPEPASAGDYYTLNGREIGLYSDVKGTQVDGIDGTVCFNKDLGMIVQIYGSSLSVIDIPAEIDGVKVRSVADWALQYKQNVTRITLPEGLETIGQGAFRACPISVIEIPDSVKSIGNYAFVNCEELESIVIGDGVESIGEYSIKDLPKLTSVKLGKSLKTIGDGCFQNLESLKKLVVPGSLKNIGAYCFRNNDALETLTFEDGAKGREIPDWSLTGNPALKTLSFGEGFEKLGQGTARSSESLTTLRLPASLKSIGNYSFRFCSRLEDVTVGGKQIDFLHQFGEQGVKLGEYPFSNCYFIRKDYSPSYKKGKWYKALHNVALTGDYQTDILNIAYSQLGYHEGNSFDEQDGTNSAGKKDYAEYNYWYGDPGTMWCGEFVDWCICMAGVPDELYSINNEDEAHEYTWKDTTFAGGSYKLKKGDVILFLHDTGDHVILVDSVKQSSNKVVVNAVDGNHSNGVVTSTWTIDAKTGKTLDSFTSTNGYVATIYGPDWKLKKNIDFYTISFNANGGKVTAKTKEVSNGAFYGVLPIPTKKGKVFDGWYTKKKGGKKITAYRTVELTGDVTLYAHWKKK